MINILVIGTNKPILATIGRLIEQGGKWSATLAYSVREAQEICLQKDFGLALIGAGLSEAEELDLRQQLSPIRPKLRLIRHYGGGSGLLFAEIYQGLTSSDENSSDEVN